MPGYGTAGGLSITPRSHHRGRLLLLMLLLRTTVCFRRFHSAAIRLRPCGAVAVGVEQLGA